MSDTFESHFERALGLRREGRLPEAVAAYDAALALRPGSIAARFNRANALQALERHAEAEDAFARLLALAPGDAEALNNRAVSLASLGRHEEALASCDAARRCLPPAGDGRARHAARCARARAAVRDPDAGGSAAPSPSDPARSRRSFRQGSAA